VPCDSRCDLIWFLWRFRNLWLFATCITYVLSIRGQRTSPTPGTKIARLAARGGGAGTATIGNQHADHAILPGGEE
jgi:hypothetical protein